MKILRGWVIPLVCLFIIAIFILFITPNSDVTVIIFLSVVSLFVESVLNKIVMQIRLSFTISLGVFVTGILLYYDLLHIVHVILLSLIVITIEKFFGPLNDKANTQTSE
jgi:hypothetical protein